MHGEVHDVAMPAVRQEGQEDFLHLPVLDFLDQVIKAFDGPFDGRNDIPRKDFGQVMPKSTQKVIDDTAAAGPQLAGTEITHDGHHQHMPHDGSLRYAGRLAPALLEPQFSNEVDEFAGLSFHGNLLDAGKVIMLFQFIPNGAFDLFNAKDAFIHMVDDAELPFRGKIVGSAEDLLFKAMILFIIIMAHFFMK